MRYLIKQYLKSIYNRYNGIILDAPTGFGTHTYFSEIIVNDLITNRKSCLIISYLQIFNKQYYENIINIIDNSIIYRTKENKYIEFENGSLIEFITYHDIVKNNFSKLSQDIIYIDGYRVNIGHRYTYELLHLIPYYKKIMLVNSYMEDGVEISDKIKSNRKTYYKNIKPFNIDKLICDMKTELRFEKIQTIKNAIE